MTVRTDSTPPIRSIEDESIEDEPMEFAYELRIILGAAKNMDDAYRISGLIDSALTHEVMKAVDGTIVSAEVYTF